MELELKYQPKQLEARNVLKGARILFYGGARGGGKSYFVRSIAVEYAYTYPGINIGIFRAHYPELEANHIEPMLNEFPHLRDYYKLARRVIEIPINGQMSRIRFSHCGSEQDLKKYQGSEFQLLIIDEAGEWTQSLITKLRASNRSSRAEIPAKLLMTGNPGGMGHGYLKRLFVDRDFVAPEKGEDYHFVQAKLEDNPAFLLADPEYRSILEQEPNEALRKAWLDGEWEVFSGQFLPEFRKDIHVIDEVDPKQAFAGWRKWLALDWGYYHPCAILWFAQNMDTGDVVIYRELHLREEPPERVRSQILRHEDSIGLKWCVAGRDMWNRAKDGGASIEEQFRSGKTDERLFFNRANDDRIQGWAQMRAYFSWHETGDGKKHGPKAKITSNCRLLIDCLSRLQHNILKPEDIKPMPWREGMRPGESDDLADCARYGFNSLPPVNKIVAAKAKDRHYDKWSKVLSQSRGGGSWRTV